MANVERPNPRPVACSWFEDLCSLSLFSGVLLMTDVNLSVFPDELPADLPVEARVDEVFAAIEADATLADEVQLAAVQPTSEPAAESPQRSAVMAAVRSANQLPPGVRERLSSLVQQTASLDATGEPLLPTRQVLDILAQGLPTVVRSHEPQSDDLSDQQAEQIARSQLQRAGWLAAA
jgi:hypothetical protein